LCALLRHIDQDLWTRFVIPDPHGSSVWNIRGHLTVCQI
jgi:hypothetical protein